MEITGKSFLNIQAAARILQAEADKWEEENNSIIKVAKLMADQMAQMAEFEKGRGRLKVNLFHAMCSEVLSPPFSGIELFMIEY